VKRRGLRHQPEPEPAAASFATAAALIWVLLALLVGARAVFAFVPNMAAWSMNVMRFLPSWVAWSTWAIAALALVPALARRVTQPRRAQRNARATLQSLSPALAVLAAMLLVLALPDRTWYVGDFLLRQGAVTERLHDETVFRQALPLDRLIHHQLPRGLVERTGLDANTLARLIGLVDAAVFAFVCAVLPQVLGVAGAAAWAASAISFFGGYLVLFTGYGKAIVELGVLTAAVGVAGLRVLRSGNGVLAFGLALALALPLHRSAVALLPASLFVWIAWLRDPRSREALRRPATWVGLALPWLTLAWVAPRVIRTFLAVDVPVHLTPSSVRDGGVWEAAFRGGRVLDLANILLMLSPLVVIAPLGVVVMTRDTSRRREFILLALLAVPMLAAMPFLHPAQGLVRDWDNFMMAGVACSLMAAVVAAEVVRTTPRWAWLGVATSLAAAIPAIQWMIHHADADRGMARMHAFVAELPPRPDAERAAALDFLGIRYLRERQPVRAAEVFRQAVELAPSPRFHIQWALAETQAGNFRGAMEVYARLIAKSPNDPVAWRGYTAMATRLEMWPEAKRGAERLLQLVPGDPEARMLIERIGAMHFTP
jgi:hypothetical protein